MVEITPYDAREPSFYQRRVDNLFYSDRWLAVLQKTYGYEYMTVLHSPTGQFIIVTPLDHLTGKKVISLPFSDYTPIDAAYQASLLALVRALQEQYVGHRIVLRTALAPDDPVASSLGNPTRQAFYHRIDTSDPDRITQSSSFRRGVKKARKAGVTIEISTSEEALRSFYSMYHRLRFDKFGSIPQPYEFFRNVHREFIATGQGFMLQAWRQQQVIASIVVLQHRSVLYYKFGCSSQEFLAHRPNNLLFHQLIAWAVEKNCVAVDLGLSGTSASYEGLVRFKESMGGVRHPITYFTLTPEGYDEQPERECKTMLSALTQTIVDQQLGAEATSQLSATIYPYFA